MVQLCVYINLVSLCLYIISNTNNFRVVRNIIGKFYSMAGIVVIFDFDKTIIDIDSDNWVIDGLGGTALFDHLLTTLPWNSAMVSLSLTSNLNYLCICAYMSVFY